MRACPSHPPLAHPFAPRHGPPQVQFDITNGERGVQAVNVRQENGAPFERAQGEGGAEGGDRPPRREGGGFGGPRRGGGGGGGFGGGERRPRRDSSE